MNKKHFIKILILLFFSASISLKSQNYIEKVNFIYLDHEMFAGSSRQILLYFKIKNSSSDTLYISRKNVNLIITKNGRILKEEANKPLGLIVSNITSKHQARITAERKQREETTGLRENFSKKLYFKNFKKTKSKEDKQYIIQLIKDDCIVLLPNSTLNYTKLFLSSEFDNTCKVTAKYVKNNKFTFFFTNNRRVNILE